MHSAQSTANAKPDANPDATATADDDAELAAMMQMDFDDATADATANAKPDAPADTTITETTTDAGTTTDATTDAAANEPTDAAAVAATDEEEAGGDGWATGPGFDDDDDLKMDAAADANPDANPEATANAKPDAAADANPDANLDANPDATITTTDAEVVVDVFLSKRQRQRQRQQRGKQTAIAAQARARVELAVEYDRLKSAVRFGILWPKAPTADHIEFVNSLYAQIPEFDDTNGAALDWAIVTGKSEHSKAGLFVLTRNEERAGVASVVEFQSDGFVLIENFAILPGVNGRGIATIFNEEIVRTLRLHIIHCHTAVTIPMESNIYAVEKVGFVRAKSQGGRHVASGGVRPP